MTSVQAALTEVMRELPAIGKAGRGPKDQGSYAYRGIEQITAELQPLLAKHGVIIAPNASVVSIQPAPGYKESWTTTVLSVKWHIIGPEGDAIEAQTIGIGHDSSDKGANKAMSQATKYLYLELFCISDKKDEVDGADYSHGVYEAPPPVKTAGMMLFDRLTNLRPETQAILRSSAKEHGKKLNVAAFDSDPEWLDLIVTILDGEPDKETSA